VLWGDALFPVATAEDALALCRQFCERRVQGVFFAPMENIPDREAVNQEIGRMLQQAGIAVVLLDRDIAEFPGRSAFDLVGIDNFAAGHVLADHLIAVGNRKFRFLARPGYPSTTDLRLAGCRESLLRARLKQTEPLAWFGEPGDAGFVRKMLAGNAPDAILCSNDQTAAKLIQTLSGMGIRLPQDVRVVGFDDVRYATLLTVPLTTIRQPCAAIGAAAVRAMQERIQAPDRPAQHTTLPFSLIVRESCGSGLQARPAE
jgi:DNA-binding LacI/PurR family transcriptional regulator